MKLFVFSSVRKIKKYIDNLLQANNLLDKAISINDFFDNILIKDKRKASNYECLFIMKKACEKTKNIDKLNIPSEFFVFLKNNEYLFSFFKELKLSNKTIADLKNNDFYAQYDEHLDILNEVYNNYIYELNQASLYDDISLKIDNINHFFLKTYDEVIFEIDGFLNQFELSILKECSKFTNIILSFKTSEFNLNYFKKLDIFDDINLLNKMKYHFRLNDKKIILQEELLYKNNEIITKGFGIKSLQSAFISNKISEFLRAGLKPENIVIITPDEDFCEILKLFDKNKMLNFAGGFSIKYTEFYQKLKTYYNACMIENFDFKYDENYFNHSNTISLNESILNYFHLQNFNDFKDNFDKNIDFEKFITLINPLLENENAELKYKIKEELILIKDLFDAKLNLRNILELFFIQINNIKLSDTHGGAITVMGLLESRGLSFDGVIIVDFNDDLIPKRSINEMFLNNELRQKAGLISHNERENLQRFYYESLIKNAKMVAISYLENEENFRSRFLDELNLNIKEDQYSDKAYINALKYNYETRKIDINPLKPKEENYNIFKEPLSFSKLDCFINYKRTYYYKYILKINPPRLIIDNNIKANELGGIIHDLLSKYYQKYPNNFNYDEFMKLFNEISYKLSKFDKLYYKLFFEEFKEFENEYFKKGHKVLECEKDYETIKNINDQQVKLIGKIDRIDEYKTNEYDTKFIILDYKTGKKDIPKKSYQLAFYELLFDKKNCEAYFYQIKNTKINKETSEKTKNDLIMLLKQLEIESKTKIIFENEKENEYCPYKLIYNKDLK